ncbi:MAG: hypothetical protein RIR01_2499 [Bacteroidota bacterium]
MAFIDTNTNRKLNRIKKFYWYDSINPKRMYHKLFFWKIYFLSSNNIKQTLPAVIG